MSLKLAEAYVRVNVDTSGMAAQMKQARGLMSSVLGGAGNTKIGGGQATKIIADNSQFAGKVNETRGMLGGLMSQVAGVGGGILAAAGIGTVIDGIKGVAASMITGNAEMERYKTSFKVFLGSEEAAAERFRELYKFAADTPFEMTEVVKSSILLQNFAGSAAATGETLTMVGDMAAASGAQFENVAFWTGRLMAQLKAGQPFGEAATRLTELGLMTGETRDKMEALTKAGKPANDIWKVFAESQARVKGMMSEQSRTFGGLASTFKDTLAMAMNTIGEPFFKVAKAGLFHVLDLLNSPSVQIGMKNIATYTSDMIDGFREFISESAGVAAVGGFFSDIGSGVIGAVRAVRQFYIENREAILTAGKFLGVVTGIAGGVGLLTGAVSVVGTALAFVFGPVGASIAAIGLALGGAAALFVEFAGEGDTFGEKITSVFQKIPAMIDLAGYAFRNFSNLAQVALIDISIGMGKAVPGWTSFLEGFSVQFVGMWDGMGAAFTHVFAQIKGGLTEMKNLLAAVFEGVKAAMGALLNAENPITAFGDAFSKTLAAQKNAPRPEGGVIDGPVEAFKKAHAETVKNAKLGLEEQGGMGGALEQSRNVTLAKIARDEEEYKRLKEEASKPVDAKSDDSKKDSAGVDLSGGGGGGGKAGGGKSLGGFSGIAEMSKSIQQSLFKSPADKAAAKTAENTQKTADLLSQNNSMMERLLTGGHDFASPVATFGG